jgi:hypothetical protein
LRQPLGTVSCRYCGDRVPAVTPTTFLASCFSCVIMTDLLEAIALVDYL